MQIDEENNTSAAIEKRNKITLHGAEYEKLKTAIIHAVKYFENQGK